MQISVIICTYNRAFYLEKALKSLFAQEDVASPFEVVIVDNNCTDATASVIAGFKETTQISLKYIKEPKQGLSHARNAGYQHSQHAVIAYLDDDAIAAPRWVHTIQSAFQKATTTQLIVGGKIEVIWEEPKPAWFFDDLLVWLGKLDLGASKEIDFPKENVNGGNLAMHKKIIELIGGFNPLLGITGGKMLTNEEIEVQKKAIALGATIRYEPEMLIWHHARKALSKEWFSQRYYGQGYSEAIMHSYHGSKNLLYITAKMAYLYIKKTVYDLLTRLGLSNDLYKTLLIHLHISWHKGFFAGKLSTFKPNN